MKIPISLPGESEKQTTGGMENIAERCYDASCLRCLIQCPTRFFYRYIEELSPLEEGRALVFGSKVHEALYLFQRGASQEEALKVWDSYDPLGDPKRTIEKGLVCTKETILSFPWDSWEVLSNEIAFDEDMEDGTRFRGRIDGVFQREGAIYVHDWKTTSRMGDSYFKKFSTDFQMHGYAYACHREFGQCEGALITAIGTGETHKGGRVQSKPVSMSPQALASWEGDYFQRVKLLEQWLQEESFPRFTEACFDFGGCPYLLPCQEGIPRRDWPQLYSIGRDKKDAEEHVESGTETPPG